ncbi:MAG: hypothetical protein R8L53_03220 [Mariprofundales bacterium]
MINNNNNLIPLFEKEGLGEIYQDEFNAGILACFENPGIILKSVVLIMIAAFCS